MASQPDPDAQAFLDAMEGMEMPELSELPVEQLREVMAQAEGGDGTPAVGAVENRTIRGPGGELSIRCYIPNGEGPFPVVVYFHGGGFVFGTLDGHDTTCRELTNAAEAVVVSVDYRLAPENPFPAAIEDGYAALEWVSENAGDIEGDTERLSVAGDSAGGNLAAALSLLARDRGAFDLDYQLLVYPAVDFDGEWPSYEENGEGYFLTRDDMHWFGEQYLESEIHTRNPYAAPMEACDLSGLPPATVLTGGFDPLRDEGVAYAERLEDAGVSVTHRHYEGMIHGFYSMLDEPVSIETGHEAVAATAEDLREAF